MPLAPPRPSADLGLDAASPLTALMSHLDAVYGFALTLAGNPEGAAELTEQVYGSVPRDLWATLGGHDLRERLLAQCVAIFTEESRSRGRELPTDVVSLRASLPGVLRDLPVEQRAAIALVDQLGLTYAAAAAVLHLPTVEFRAVLRRGRCALVGASRAAASFR